MVTVEYTRTNKAFCLQVYGHARSAPKGEDLVCCAASTLAYTAAQSALELYEDGALRQFPDTVMESGSAQVAAVATPEDIERVAQMFRTIATGYEMLARQYPEYIMFRETVQGNDEGRGERIATSLRSSQ